MTDTNTNTTFTLSKDTMSVLESVKNIQPNLVIEQSSNKLKTISEAQNFFAEIELDQDFPENFYIYDLSEFLSCYSFLENPTLEFHSDHVVIVGQNGSKIKYILSPLSILTYPKKDVIMPETCLDVILPEKNIIEAYNAGVVLQNSIVELETDGNGNVYLNVIDANNPTSNNYTQLVETDNNCDQKIKAHFSRSHLNVVSGKNNCMLPGDYRVSLSEKLISKWTNQSRNAVYFLALENTSKFE